MLATSEDPAEMLHKALHQGLYRLLKLKHSSENEIQLQLEIITSDPLHVYNIPSNVHCNILSGLRHDKTCLWGFDKVILKLACSATETS